MLKGKRLPDLNVGIYVSLVVNNNTKRVIKLQNNVAQSVAHLQLLVGSQDLRVNRNAELLPRRKAAQS